MRVKCIFSIGDPPDMQRRNEAATRLQSHLEVLERFLCSSIPEASKKSRPSRRQTGAFSSGGYSRRRAMSAIARNRWVDTQRFDGGLAPILVSQSHRLAS